MAREERPTFGSFLFPAAVLVGGVLPEFAILGKQPPVYDFESFILLGISHCKYPRICSRPQPSKFNIRHRVSQGERVCAVCARLAACAILGTNPRKNVVKKFLLSFNIANCFELLEWWHANE